MNKKPLYALLTLGLLLTACTADTSPETDDTGAAMEEEQSSSVAAMQDASSVAATEDDSADTVDVDVGGSVDIGTDESATMEQSQVVRMTVDNFTFTPSAIAAKRGQKLQVELTGAAGIHGFAVPDLAINQRVEAGQTVTVAVPTDKPGTYTFFCSIPCGSGHRDMKGTIVIQ